MHEARTYPEGVHSWIDIEQPDLPAAMAFYGGLFGWSFESAEGPHGDAAYVVARHDGREAAGLAAHDASPGAAATWNTYVAATDAEAAARRVVEAGGTVRMGPVEAGRAGRAVMAIDPAGAAFRLWEAGTRPGVQAVNEPGAWNFAYLQTTDAAEPAFYRRVFGWEFADLGFSTLVRAPGYGDHLAATVDPHIRERQADVATPQGFEDAIAWLAPPPADEPSQWHVSFTVADRDDAAATAERLGGRVLSSTDTEWTRDAVIRDPQGGRFTASQFVPPGR
ncbi:VOC family protein [Agromyces sp. NPDC055661]